MISKLAISVDQKGIISILSESRWILRIWLRVILDWRRRGLVRVSIRRGLIRIRNFWLKEISFSDFLINNK